MTDQDLQRERKITKEIANDVLYDLRDIKVSNLPISARIAIEKSIAKLEILRIVSQN